MNMWPQQKKVFSWKCLLVVFVHLFFLCQYTNLLLVSLLLGILPVRALFILFQACADEEYHVLMDFTYFLKSDLYAQMNYVCPQIF